MERACRVCDDTIAVVAPKVRPGATMLELVEELEHSMRLLGSRAFVHDPRLQLRGGKNSAEESHSEPIEEGDVVMFDFGAVVDGYCSDFGRTVCVGAGSGGTRCLRPRSRRTGSRPRGAPAGSARERGQPRVSRADRGGRPRTELQAPHGPRNRAGRPRAPVRLRGRRDAPRDGHDVHRRAVDPRRRSLRRPDRGRGGLRADGGRKLNRFPPTSSSTCERGGRRSATAPLRPASPPPAAGARRSSRAG